MLVAAVAISAALPVAPPVAGPVATASPPSSPTAVSAPARVWSLPEPNSGFDYQIGGAYALPGGVTTEARDRTAQPAPGAYNVCYVNGFQTQSEELASVWRTKARLLLAKPGVRVPRLADPTKRRDVRRYWVKDSAWDEILLDVSTGPKRRALLRIVGPWIDGCAADGFQAVEVDNLDSWTRNRQARARLRKRDAAAFATLLAARAHRGGLAIAQKNTTRLVSAKDRIGFDFVVAESCARYRECGVYTKSYGDHVIDIEYSDRPFERACSDPGIGHVLSVVRRDRNVTTPGSSTYRYEAC